MIGEIHEFDPVIYPLRVWVTIKPSPKDVINKFYGLDMEGLVTDLSEDDIAPKDGRIAQANTVVHKSDNQKGVIVIIHRPSYMRTRTICHEACHCADFFCDELGITSRSFEDGEAYAYLTGWIAGCIEKVKLSK